MVSEAPYSPLSIFLLSMDLAPLREPAPATRSPSQPRQQTPKLEADDASQPCFYRFSLTFLFTGCPLSNQPTVRAGRTEPCFGRGNARARIGQLESHHA